MWAAAQLTSLWDKVLPLGYVSYLEVNDDSEVQLVPGGAKAMHAEPMAIVQVPKRTHMCCSQLCYTPISGTRLWCGFWNQWDWSRSCGHCFLTMTVRSVLVIFIFDDLMKCIGGCDVHQKCRSTDHVQYDCVPKGEPSNSCAKFLCTVNQHPKMQQEGLFEQDPVLNVFICCTWHSPEYHVSTVYLPVILLPANVWCLAATCTVVHVCRHDTVLDAALVTEQGFYFWPSLWLCSWTQCVETGYMSGTELCQESKMSDGFQTWRSM